MDTVFQNEQDLRTVERSNSTNTRDVRSIVTTERQFDGPPSKETIAKIQELRSFKKLEDGWDGYNATALSDKACDLGLCVLHALDQYTVVETIVPGPSDELELCFTYNGYDIELFVDDVDFRWIVMRDGVENQYFTDELDQPIFQIISEGINRLK